MTNLAVFASGSGSNFEAIARSCADGRLDARVVVCVCDRPGAGVVERARRLGVPVLEFRPRDYAGKRDFERMIADRLDEEGVELVCLAGYMRIVGEELLGRYGGRILNIHPALLPAFPGAHAIRDAFEYGVKVYGVTIHYIDETIDGGTIVSQAAVPYDGDDIDEVEAMIHQAEHRLYVDTISRIINSKEGKQE
ncbi:MAG: phosphoribosylglycinamide formyltransferase [Muribaculaceae bacterium]|nr:phosphoribosylglycinamide formyltransferase [Muribaculaceae bacterium]